MDEGVVEDTVADIGEGSGEAHTDILLTVRVAGGFADNFGSCALTNVDLNRRGRGRGY